MKNIKLIIFDLDGTLVDAYQAIAKSFNYTMRELNYPKQGGLVIRRAVGWGDANLLAPFIRAGDLEKALRIYRRHHRVSLLTGSRLFLGAKKALHYLKKKGYKLAVASNRPTEFSWIMIRRLKLKRYFDYVLCADKLRHIKPHPEILNKILQRFSLKPKHALYVGDMVIDAKAGRAAKVNTIIVAGGSSAIEEIKKEKPYLVIRAIADLMKIL